RRTRAAWRQDGHRLGYRARRRLARLRQSGLRHRRRAAGRRRRERPARLIRTRASTRIVSNRVPGARRRVAALFASATAAACATVIYPITVQAAEPDLAALDRYVNDERAAQHIPGLALGLVHGDRIVHVAGFGAADASGRAVDGDTPFILGSTTKSFTALA